MRVAHINMVNNGSTGKIMLQISKTARDAGHESICFSTQVYSLAGKEKKVSLPYHLYWGSFFENGIHYALGSAFGRNGCFSSIGTMGLIRKLKGFKPDIIHLHNLHSFCINIPMLFRYIKKNKIRVVWTLHDCWSFTGQCPNFDMIKCEKWKYGCFECPQCDSYPKSRIDNSKRMYSLKKKWFSGVYDMTLVTPSEWLAGLVKQSFLKNYPVKVINNGIDLSVFKPVKSTFRQKYKCENKKIVLGVAFGWGVRKGLDVFIELSQRLDENYQIVLVGTDENVDKQLPRTIISIHKTNNQQELAEIYSSADVLVNPTREDNYPTVNMESIACGTPVITFKTGGSPEIVGDNCGFVVERDDLASLETEIVRVCNDHPFSQDACLTKALDFNMSKKFKEYIDLYEDSTYSTNRSL